MKRLIKTLAGGLLLALTGAKASASSWVYGDYLLNDPTLSYSTTPVLDTETLQKGPIDNLAMQAIYSTSTVGALTFTDGTAAYGHFVVVSTANLTSAMGTNTLVVVSTAMPATAAITLRNKTYTMNASGSWSLGTTSTNTAASIAALFAGIPGFTSSRLNSTVTVACASSGTFCNSIGLSVNTASMTVGGATFSGGADNLVVGLGGYVVTAGTDFTPVSTATGTASAIRAALNANASIVALATNTVANAVVYSTAIAAGTAGNSITMFSNSSSVTVTGATLSGGVASAINTSNSSIRIPSHGISTGFAVLFSTVSNSVAPTGLTNQTTYYAIVVDANNIKLATSSANALAGTAVSITGQVAAGGGSFSLTPLAFSGTASFKWQSSNDGTNFYDLPLDPVAIVSTTTATNVMWDGPINYRYLRFNFTGPTTGGVNIKVKGNGKGFQ